MGAIGTPKCTPIRHYIERRDFKKNEEDVDGERVLNLLSPEAPSKCYHKQSLLSSLISSPCNYDIPEGLSVSFSAEPNNSSSKQSSHKNNSFSELVEFQATINMPTDDAASHSYNNDRKMNQIQLFSDKEESIMIMEDTNLSPQ